MDLRGEIVSEQFREKVLSALPILQAHPREGERLEWFRFFNLVCFGSFVTDSDRPKMVVPHRTILEAIGRDPTESFNTGDLIWALENEQIQGAGIDVYEKEPPDRDLKLFDLDRATLSAHLGWCSEEAGWTIRYKILDDIVACINGEKPVNTVNEELDHILEGNYREV